MFSVLLLQLIGRNLFDILLEWPEEMALMTMIWLTFFGAYQCTVENTHLKVSFLEDRLSEKNKPYLELFSKVAMLTLVLLVTFNTYPLISIVGNIGTPVMAVPMWVPYSFIWVSATLMSMEIICQIIETIKKIATFKTSNKQEGETVGEVR
ncbi:TRAP transporter small permease [Geomicrobium sp. JSM 1781026]|uniref:TRAP transporter small permease n=1 Tax=Geomicrobium sp. JSM 1781026 TaxID=3344580 RepID=UPI0035BF4DDA